MPGINQSRFQKKTNRKFYWFIIPIVLIILVAIIIMIVYLKKKTSDECKTPDGTLGFCTMVEDCKDFKVMFNLDGKNKNFIDFMLKSRCDKSDDDNPKICCGIYSEINGTENNVQWKVGERFSVGPNDNCQTPQGTRGQCMLINECEPLYNVLLNRNRPKVLTDYLIRSQCGQEQRTPKVCCEITSANVQRCFSPERIAGTCVDANKCRTLINITLVSNENWNTCSGCSDCVCCPPAPITYCKTPNNRDGKCIGIEHCGPLQRIMDGRRPMTKSEIDLIKESQCDSEYENSICCEIQKPENLLPKECYEDLQDRIVGGAETELDQYPWMVQLESNANERRAPFCGGSLITSMYVLTAAHCNDETVDTVKIGEHNMRTLIDCQMNYDTEICNEPYIRVSIVSFHNHPLYRSNPDINDIALVRLEKEVPFIVQIKPICLPNFDITTNKQQGRKVYFIAAGWGLTENRVNSAVKRHVNLPYLSINNCKFKNVNASELKNDDAICAGGEKGRDSCNGDSGGPLMYTTADGIYLVGIVSSGTTECGLENIGGIYTNVFKHKKWILSMLRP